MMERTENEFLIQCLVCQENENFLSIQLLLYPFILLFNLLENRQKSNYTLHCIGKNFPFTFLSKIGRIKIMGPTCFFYPSFFLSFLFSSLPNNSNKYFPLQNPSKIFRPSTFPYSKWTLKPACHESRRRDENNMGVGDAVKSKLQAFYLLNYLFLFKFAFHSYFSFIYFNFLPTS